MSHQEPALGSRLDTVCVKAPDRRGGFLRINRADLDATHEVIPDPLLAPVAAPVAAPKAAEAPPVDPKTDGGLEGKGGHPTLRGLTPELLQGMPHKDLVALAVEVKLDRPHSRPRAELVADLAAML